MTALEASLEQEQKSKHEVEARLEKVNQELKDASTKASNSVDSSQLDDASKKIDTLTSSLEKLTALASQRQQEISDLRLENEGLELRITASEYTVELEKKVSSKIEENAGSELSDKLYAQIKYLTHLVNYEAKKNEIKSKLQENIYNSMKKDLKYYKDMDAMNKAKKLGAKQQRVAQKKKNLLL